jgi:4-hydroxyacetophenone monooxygenase
VSITEAGVPITEGDAEIRAALEQVEVAPLLAAVAQLTGELDLLRDDLRPDPNRSLEPDGGLTPAAIETARGVIADALARYRDAGCPPAPEPDPAALRRIMAFLVGEDNVESYEDLLREELAVEGGDLRAPAWHKDEVAPDVTFQVAVIGAGMSGLLAAHRLRQAGVDVVVLEKNDDVGGTWFENTYPGCRVDVPNHLYSYSFAQTDWPQHFSTQAELLGYFQGFADRFGLRPLVRFGTEVLSATLDEGSMCWQVQVRTPDGAEEVVEANAVISAVGQLNRPSFPDIPGVGDFAGPAFHSARWDHSVDLAGKRVAVIGTGASAAQLIPHVAEEAGELLVFQRTPNWFAPTPDYHDEVPGGMRWLMQRVGPYGPWYRVWLFWRMHEGLLPAAVVDPEWESEGQRSVSAPNEMVRLLLSAYIEAEFADRPDLLPAVLPQYPPMAKRIIRDNGVWARTLKRDDVSLITERIERITPDGIVTADGVEHRVDVLIYGTGFCASEFLTPMQVTGRDGVDLHERWKGDARAYLGITVPEFPNLFCLYGPNTNIVINGSIIYFSECEVRYVTEAVRLLLEGRHRAMDVRPEVHDGFNERIDAANRTMAWGASSVNSWYKNRHGRVAQNWPFSLLEYWERTKAPDPADYELL